MGLRLERAVHIDIPRNRHIIHTCCEDIHYKNAIKGLVTAFQRTLGEVNFFPASGTRVLFIKFIGKNFFFLSAVGAFAGKRFQISRLFKTRAMLRC